MKKRTVSDAEKIRLLPVSITRGAFNTFFGQLTFGAAVFVLYLTELGLTKTQIGFIRSLLPFAGVMAPFIAPATRRFGYKRTFIIFYGARKWIIAAMAFAPVLVVRIPQAGLIAFIATIVALFALCRSVAETAQYPWLREYVPDPVRGKFTAAAEIAGTLMGIVATAIASRIVGGSDSIYRFVRLFVIGCSVGFAGVMLAAFIPGGAPRRRTEAITNLSDLSDVFRNPAFRKFLVGLALVTLAQVPLASFVPLYLRESVGMSTGRIVFLETGIMAGGLFFSYLWGWTADRYGSKSVVSISLSLYVVLPLLWILLTVAPAASESATGVVAFLLSFLFGAARVGFYIGSTHMIYNSIVPTDKEGPYLSVYYAFIGLFGGIGPFVAGRMLDVLDSSYYALFTSCSVLLAAGLIVYRTIRSGTRTREFLRLFFYGNPFAALGLTIRFTGMLREDQRLNVAKRMGQTGSPLHAEELVQMFEDPSFSVRYEAVLSAGRSPVDSRITESLMMILDDDGNELQIAAAWALGRSGNREAVPALRRALHSNEKRVGAMAARALGMLGDVDSLATFVSRLKDPDYTDVVTAYASAVGSLHHNDGLEPLLTAFTAHVPGSKDLVSSLAEREIERELLLAVAQVAGVEPTCIKLWRQSSGGGQDSIITRTVAGSLLSYKKQFLLRIGAARTDAFFDAVERDDVEATKRTFGSVLEGFAEHEPLESSTATVMRFCHGLIGAGSNDFLLFAVACVSSVLHRRRHSRGYDAQE